MSRSFSLREFPAVIVSLILCALSLSMNGAMAQETQDSASATYQSLADILEDEASRDRLIAELRQLSSPDAEAAVGDVGASDEASGEAMSFARQIANTSQDVAQTMVRELSSGLEALRELGAGARTMDVNVLTLAVIDLSLVIGVTVILFFLFRLMARPVFSACNRWALKETAGSPLLRKFFAVVGAALLDLVVIVIAYIGGYALALFVIGEPGEMDTRESLFLNAFLVIEAFKAIIRALFASKDDGLRLMPLTAEQSAYWNAWLARLSGFIGYGMLLLVPIVNFNVSPAVGRMLAVLIMTLAFLYALVIVLQNKTLVRERLEGRALKAELGFTRMLWGMLARSWHLLAIVYFGALLILTVMRPEDALPFMLTASVKTLLAGGVGLFVSVVLSQLMSRGFRVNEETREKFPMLEARLNNFIPNVMKIVRLVILAIVLAFVADAWGVFNLPGWLASEMGSRSVGATISVIIIVTLAAGLWIALASWIEQRLNPNTGTGEPSAREKTLLTLFRNALAIIIVVMTAMIVLAEIGINIGPLIAGAGVLGLAIGFGAQKLVQDIITGIFIQLENAINAGDIVTAAGITGTAEKLTIRSLGIRDLSGTFHIIPFSSVDSVSNYMRDFAYHVGEYGVAYREDIDEVIVKLREAFDELISDPDQKINIVGDFEVHGVTALADSSVNIRVRIKTLPGVQWAVGRAYNRLVKYHLDAAGIEIPFPHMTMYFGQDKNGTAPPAPVVIESRGEPRSEPPEEEDDNAEPGKLTDERAETNARPGEDFDDEK